MSSKTRISVILDASGSMFPHRQAVIEAFDNFVQEQRQVPGKTRWTLLQFSSFNARNYTFQDVKGRDVPPLTKYNPAGLTPLLDALGTELTKLLQDTTTPTVVVINTDGQENHSTDYTLAQVKALIQRGQDLNWQFIWAGVDLNALGEATHYGVDGYTVTGSQPGQILAAVSDTVTAYRTSNTVTKKDATL